MSGRKELTYQDGIERNSVDILSSRNGAAYRKRQKQVLEQVIQRVAIN